MYNQQEMSKKAQDFQAWAKSSSLTLTYLNIVAKPHSDLCQSFEHVVSF
jgi:hypothetical protein